MIGDGQITSTPNRESTSGVAWSMAQDVESNCMTNLM
jgi:hypothetical protein